MELISCGDGIEGLRSMDDDSVDIILTSPPFKEEDISGDYWEFYDAIVSESNRVAEKAVLIIHTSTKMNEFVSRYWPKRTLIWSKGIVKYSYRYNPIYVFQPNDDYKVNKYIYSDTFGIPPIMGSVKVHRYEDPVILYYELLKMFKGCSSVHDPFCGSGTTLEAAHRLGMTATGTEIEPENVALSLERVSRPRLSSWN